MLIETPEKIDSQKNNQNEEKCLLYIPYNYKNLYKSSSDSITFLYYEKNAVHNSRIDEDNFEHIDPNKSALRLSPIFGAEVAKACPPLPKYISWDEINNIYNK